MLTTPRTTHEFLVDQVLQRLYPAKQTQTHDALGLEFRGAAAKLFKSRDREVLLDGPAGTGKTIGALWYLHLLAANNPGFQGLLLRKTNVSLSGSTLVTWRRHVLGRESFGAKYYGGSRERPAGYLYPNGSFIAIGGLQPDASKIMSSEYDGIFVNEATELTLDDWEAIITRLRSGILPYQQIIADCNPQAPTHWLNQRAEAKTTTRLLSRHEDNPRWFTRDGEMTPAGEEYIGGTLDRLTGVRYQRLRLGKWVSAEGQVYEQWRDELHLVSREDLADVLNGAWHFGVADWGWSNPGVLHVYAVDGDERLYLVHEVYMTHRPVEGWWAPKAAQLSADYGFSLWVCDPSEPAYIEEFNKKGLDAKGARNDLMPGIGAVQNRLIKQDDGRPRLFFLRDCLEERDEELVTKSLPWSTHQEIGEYVWPKKASGLSTEKPVDANNHGMDCVRYAVAELDIRGGGGAMPAPVSVGNNTFFPLVMGSGDDEDDEWP